MIVDISEPSSDHSLAVIDFSSQEREAKVPQASTMERATRLFAADGCLLVKDVFSPQYIRQLHQSYVEQLRQRVIKDGVLEVGADTESMLVGDRRVMIPIEFRSPFDRPELYANPLLLPIIQTILGPECVISSFGSVVSLPGALEQHIHRDHPGLFGEEQVDGTLPCFGLTVVIPLVDVTQTTGTTRIWKGSHRFTQRPKDWIISNLEYQDPMMPVGSCLFMDYRLLHTGTANISKDQPRPILYNVYSRPWFRDYRNYKTQLPIQISKEAYEFVPEPYKDLFSWAHLYRLVRDYDATVEQDL